jgi:hypothetical protein
MPYTLNRVGTKYYGKRDLGEDGSFVTTEWFVMIDIPIIPLGSFRVLPTGSSMNLFFIKSRDYRVQRVPLNWRQVINVYLVAIALLVTLFFVLELLAHLIGNNGNSSTQPHATFIYLR